MILVVYFTADTPPPQDWLELLPKLIDNLNEFKRLFSSLNE